MTLSGRTAVITGASHGLGVAIATDFVKHGASVFLCARNLARLQENRQKFTPLLQAGQRIEIVQADVAKAEDVDALFAAALAAFPKIDILVNNAGVYGPMGRIEAIDWQAWVEAIQINLLGAVYCCRAVLPHFRSNRYGKIINLSGGGATNPLPNISAYAASKAAVVRFTETLALETSDDHIDVNSVAPGALVTKMMDDLAAAGPAAVGADFYARMMKIRDEGGTPLDKGAALCTWLASAESDGITGKLISAVWDPWRELQKHAEDLGATDIYTLRRIVPKDRGKTWGG